jgi:predicted HAD superfamily phosphohydrolase YqeG
MTDVLGCKRCKIKVCLIGPIDKRTDILSTRINRGIESFFLRRIKKKMRNEYDLKLKVFAGDEND